MADARILKTRAALAEAVLALAVEKDFGKATIVDIVERAGVSYPTFFRHYRDKAALLVDVADTLMNDLLAVMMPALLLDDTLAASVTLCRFVDARRAFCGALLAGDAEDDIRRHLVERATRLAQATDLNRAGGLPKDLLITHSVTATLGLLAWWLDQGADLDARAMGEVIDRLVMRPIRAGPNHR
jgi:AcrR family transcriptional regulator